MRFVPARPLTTRPSVSVVIPCYNYGRFLPDAVASALNQEGVDVDVLIVDDASTDDSAEVARSLAQGDDRVSVLEHTTNAGHIQTYNDGLTRARGDYVTLVSADDVLMPNSLTRAVALMELQPRVGLVYGYARSFTTEPPRSSPNIRNWSIYPGHQWLGLAARRGRCFLVSPEAVMRREALDQTDGYDHRLPHSADFDMWMRTAARWDVARVNGPIQAAYRVHESNMHLTTFAGWHTDLEERRKTFDILFEERAADLPAVQALRPLAMRALARQAVRISLTAGRGHDPAASRAYLDFAGRVHPPVRAGLAWRLAEHRLASDRFALPGPPQLVTRVGHHLRWRRERRYGT